MLSLRPLISYAQQGEDVVLWRAFRHVPHGFYIDIGAHDPVQDSVTKIFYDHGWRGVNVEPQHAQYAALCAQRPEDINLNVAIGEIAGARVLHEVPAASGLSTFDEALARHYREATELTVVDREVEVVTLQGIVDDLVEGPVQFLKVDVEGYEERVLRGVAWQVFRPRAIVVEATRPDEWEHHLTANGYTRTLFDGLNLFFVRDEDREELGPALSVPANVHDGYEVWRYVHPLEQLGRRVEALQARVDELEAGAATPSALLRGLAGLNRRTRRWLRSARRRISPSAD